YDDKSFKYGIFRIPRFGRWVVVVHKPEHIQEIWKASDEILSFDPAANELFQSAYNFGENVISDPYHFTILRTQLTKNLKDIFPSLHEELTDALNEYIPARKNEWLELEGMKTIIPILSRGINRALVGYPLCRDPDWMNLNIRFAIDVVNAVRVLQLTPQIFKRFASSWLTNTSLHIASGVKRLEPMVAERQRKIGENDSDRPNDCVTWMMELKDQEHDAEELTKRLFDLNGAGLHSTRITFCHILFHLAECPEFANELRMEVETITKQEGWTYIALSKMLKIDSFIKESQRLHAIRCLSLPRLAQHPFTFSDGTHIPVGTYITAATHVIHTYESNYENPLKFEPFRFLDKSRKENQTRKTDMTATQIDNLTWGLGPHACPARFFVANELKLLLALMVVKYDVRMAKPGPQPVWIVDECLPDEKARVLFRRREE
ncbi:hypothetical protein CVT25_002721, partial [Psilocybe cyanescens]